MPYCSVCGAEYEDGSSFCPKCGSPLQGSYTAELATWGERFIAFLIDVIILGIVFAFMKLPGIILMRGIPYGVPYVHFGGENIVQFLYWTFMDQYYGQSLGKMVMKIRVTKFGGAPLELMDSAVESFGKAFLAPIDVIIGWIIYPGRNQRLFNNLSDTVVIKDRGS